MTVHVKVINFNLYIHVAIESWRLDVVGGLPLFPCLSLNPETAGPETGCERVCWSVFEPGNNVRL